MIWPIEVQYERNHSNSVEGNLVSFILVKFNMTDEHFFVHLSRMRCSSYPINF